jgi:hypothetical protein
MTLKLVTNNTVSFEVLQRDDMRELYIKEKDCLDIGRDQLVYISNKNNYDILRFAGHNTDVIDLAYPHQWRDNDPLVDARFKRGDYAFWSYEIDTIFGAPLWFKEVLDTVITIIYNKVESGDYEVEN